MSIRNIAEVRPRLDEAVASLPGEPADAADLYERTLMVSQQVLDSEAYDYEPEGALQELLASYLYVRQIELGLLPFPDPREE